MLVIMPIKSAHNPANKLYLIFFIPTLPKYNPITYKVVSVEPCITDAKKPIKLSGQYFEKILFKYAREALPDTGFISASGNISTGIFMILNIGFNRLKRNSRNPLLINILTARIIAIKVGNSVLIILKLSTTPSKNVS